MTSWMTKIATGSALKEKFFGCFKSKLFSTILKKAKQKMAELHTLPELVPVTIKRDRK